jgi:hypothetical protein
MTEFTPQVTFVLFTFNEESRIERVIRNFLPFGPVLIVDNESSDRTQEIGLQHGCEILINKNAGWVEDEITTARVKKIVKTPWIYWGFADEMVAASTMQAILSSVSSGRYDIVNVARKNYYYGEFCGDLFADRLNRIFKKDAIDFSGNKIHCFGKITPGSRIHQLPLEYFVHHFISNTAKSYLGSMDRYTDTERLEDRQVPGTLRLILSGLKMIGLNVFLRRGYRAGLPGYFLVANTVYYRWLSTMKLYEKKACLDRDVIEQKNDIFRNRILDSFRRSS